MFSTTRSHIWRRRPATPCTRSALAGPNYPTLARGAQVVRVNPPLYPRDTMRPCPDARCGQACFFDYTCRGDERPCSCDCGVRVGSARTPSFDLRLQ